MRKKFIRLRWKPWRQLLFLITFLVLTSLSCQAVMGTLNAPDEAHPLTVLDTPAPGAATATAVETVATTPAEPTLTESAPGDPEPTPTVQPVAPGTGKQDTGDQQTVPQGEAFEVRYHPDGPLFVGDRVSIEVIPAQTAEQALPQSAEVQVRLAENGEELGSSGFAPFGIGKRDQVTLKWVWDTSTIEPGEHELTFSLEPGGVEWTETVVLLPGGQVPPPEPEARWMQVESECCIYHFISGTEADRDLEDLVDLAEAMSASARVKVGEKGVEPPEGTNRLERLFADNSKKIEITFLPRVLGHGGFAGEEISVSYLDRNYSGGGMDLVLHHEMVHILDSRLGGEYRPSLFVEGLAVYLSGGHFKAEPLFERAAGLLQPEAGCVPASEIVAGVADPSSSDPVCRLGSYLPLQPLMDDFYFSQHELGYLQAGALVEYMVQTWGEDAFDAFYRDIQPLTDDRGKVQDIIPSDVVDRALVEHFDLTLAELEAGFTTALEEVDVTAEWVEDVRLTVAFYDTVRRYQELLDPSAYFLYAWLPGNAEMREEGIVADYLRRPISAENVTLESLLVQADEELRRGDYPAVQRLLDTVNQGLDQVEQ